MPGDGMGMIAGANVINFGMEQAGNELNENRRYYWDQQRMRDQIEANKELTSYNMWAQKEMWDYTGYENQKKQMLEAGLNPALLYGKGGGGGQTAGINTGGMPSAGSASGGTNNKSSMDMYAMMQLELLKAQKENIQADTANKIAQEQGTGQDNALKALLLGTDANGNDTSTGEAVSGAKSAAFQEAATKIKEMETEIKLMRERGETENAIQEKVSKEIQLLKNQINWEALDITGDNIGGAIQTIIKMILGQIKPR